MIFKSQVMKQMRVKTEINQHMKCRDAEILIIDILAAGKSVDMTEALSQHVYSCNSCSGFLKELVPGFEELNGGRRNIPDPYFYDRLMIRRQHSDQSQTQKARPVTRIIRIGFVVTAAAAVFLGIWIGGKMINTMLPVQEDTSVSSLTERTGLIQSYASELHLEDETTLVLESYLFDNENTAGHDTE
jgi:hypothetical protein